MNSRVFHGWYVVATCFLCMLVAAGIGWFTFPVFIRPLEQEFGWSRMQITGAVGLWAGVSAVFAPLLGHLVDRFGSRRIMLAGVATAGLASWAVAEIRSLSHLYIVLVFAALGTAASTYIPVTSTVNRWFIERRGLAMSIAMFGMGMGGFVMPNVSNFLIEHVGWRWAYRLFGLAIWVILLPPVALWLYGRPSDIGLKALGDGSGDAGPSDSGVEQQHEGFSTRQAFTMASFWGIGIADFTNAIAVVGLSVHMVAFSIDAGIENSVAAFAFSLIMAVAMIGTLGVGAAADRFDRRVMISLSYGLPAFAVLFLFGLHSAGPLFCFAVFSGVCSAGRTALWPLIVNDCFGKRAYATVIGFLVIFYNLGTVLGPPLAGFIYDTTGSYYWVFVISAAAFVVSGISMSFARSMRSNLYGGDSG